MRVYAMNHIKNLPEGWVATTLSELCVLNPKHAKKIKNSTEISFIPMANVSDTLGKISSSEVRLLGEVRKGYTHFAENDIIWAKITPCMENGKSAIAKGLHNGLACGSTEFYVLRQNGAVISEFLHQYLRQESYRKEAKMFMSGAVGQQRVPKDFLLNSTFFLPPFPEQKRISKKIESLQSRSTKARKALKAIPPLLEKFRQSVLASAFRGDLTADWRAQNPDIEPAEKLLERIRKERRKRWEENELAKIKAKGQTPKDDNWKKKYKEPEPVDTTDLPELPEGWCWGPLEILGIHQSGIAYKSKDFTNSGIQVIKLGNLYQGRFDLSRDPTFLPQDHPAVFEGLLHPGDLIISQTGTRFKRDYGNFVIIPDDAEDLVLNQRLLRVRLVESSLAKWVLYTTRLTFYRDYFFSRETGGVNQGNVGVEGVMRGPIPFGPYQEMKVILRQLEDITKYTENIETISRKEIRNLSQLDQSIVAKAFRGELVPQDPNDEPAFQLLKRIKQEKATLEARKKKIVKMTRKACG